MSLLSLFGFLRHSWRATSDSNGPAANGGAIGAGGPSAAAAHNNPAYTVSLPSGESERGKNDNTPSTNQPPSDGDLPSNNLLQSTNNDGSATAANKRNDAPKKNTTTETEMVHLPTRHQLPVIADASAACPSATGMAKRRSGSIGGDCGANNESGAVSSMTNQIELPTMAVQEGSLHPSLRHRSCSSEIEYQSPQKKQRTSNDDSSVEGDDCSMTPVVDEDEVKYADKKRWNQQLLDFLFSGDVISSYLSSNEFGLLKRSMYEDYQSKYYYMEVVSQADTLPEAEPRDVLPHMNVEYHEDDADEGEANTLGASTTAAQKKKDDTDTNTNGTFGEYSTWASKPSPPPVEPNVNPFQRPDDQSATNDLSSSLPPSHSSSTSITTITPSSPIRSCCINIPEPSNKKYSSDRATFLTNGISNPILPTKNNTAFWDNLGQLQTITHNEDVRGGDDDQKKPYDNHVLVQIEGRPVLRVPPFSEEVLVIKPLIPQYYKDATTNAICKELSHYYNEDGSYHGHKWHGMNVSLRDDILWQSEVGIVKENEELLRNHIKQRMNTLAPASPHWSGLLDIEYSCDVPLLQTFTSSKTIPYLLNLSATGWSFFNALVQASLGLTPDPSRSPEALGPNAIFARNNTQASASFDDVLTRFADAVSKSGVFAYLSAVKHDMGRISMWNEPALKQLCSVQKGKGKGRGKKAQPQCQLELVTCNWNNGKSQDEKTINLYALIPSGQEVDRLQTQLRLLVLCASFVFSPKSLDEMKSLLVGIYWKARKIQQQHSVAELVTNTDLSRDIFSAIIGYVTTENIPPKPKCARLGCNNFAAQNPDPRKRAGKYDHRTCNEPACANRCGWHVDGVRCEHPRKVADRAFCNGKWCNHLHTGTQAAFWAEKKERENAKELFC